MDAPYATFLASADLQAWLQCLAHYEAPPPGAAAWAGDPVPFVVQGLCVAQYTRWLAGLCGDDAAHRLAGDVFARLAARVDDDAFTGSRVLAEAAVAAGRGYTAAARRLLEADAAIVPQEIVLLVMPTAPARRAQALKPYVSRQPAARTFTPTLYFYAHALLDLGYIGQVQEVIDGIAADARGSLLLDLEGKLLELRGAWHEASAAYGASDWLTHKYRASICAAIAAGQAGGEAPVIDDERLQRALGMSGAESDQIEAVRSASFVNACRWHQFDSWLVHHELGALAFRRRRHAEADHHLRIAAERAPDAHRFAITRLRFVNLTWLSGTAADSRLPAEPETLECGWRAIAAPAPEESKVHIRIYLARATSDLTLLPTDPGIGTRDERGEINELRGRTADALRCWCEAAADDYVPRAVNQMIVWFETAGFEQTADALVQSAMRESWDDFFQLWELGLTVLQVLGTGRAAAARPRRLDRFGDILVRLEELADVEFQHLIRAWSLYARCDEAAFAARVLQRAADLAETPEEHLLVAASRRPAAGDEADPGGLDSLLRAERESSQRLERLEIARELAAYGQLARARRVLQQESVFDPAARLEPLEYVVALQCGRPCLSDEELAALRARAAADLERDLQSRRISRFGERFMRRLGIATPAPSAAAGGAPATDAADEHSAWSVWKEAIESHAVPRLEEARAELERWLAGLDDPSRVRFFRLAIWRDLHSSIDRLITGIRETRPDRDPFDTPIRRAESMAVNARATMVSQLWRDYLSAADEGESTDLLERVTAFYDDEQRLEDEWEALRREKMRIPCQRAAYLIEYATQTLDAIAEAEGAAGAWPRYLPVGASILADIDRLRKELDARARLTHPQAGEAA